VNISDLRRKAKLGSAVAQSILGARYLKGIEADHKEAFRLLSSAAQQGASRAKTNLAHVYAEGLGTEKSLPEAVGLYEAAAEAGEFLAQIALGRMYSGGAGVAANLMQLEDGIQPQPLKKAG
jgi:TPR repeat protein